MHHQTFFCHLACSLPLVLSAVVLQDEGTTTPCRTSCCHSPMGASASGAMPRTRRPPAGAHTPVLGWILLKQTQQAGTTDSVEHTSSTLCHSKHNPAFSC